MFDAEKFIDCVQERPAIWDKGSKEYSDKNIREKKWSEVGESMYGDWTEMVDSERQEKVKEMKNKWRHIRDNYLKFLNHGKSGDVAPNKKKKYVYADVLTFLLSTVEKKRTTRNKPENEGENRREEDTFVDVSLQDDGSEVSPSDLEADISNPQVPESLRKADSEFSVNKPRKTQSPSIYQNELTHRCNRPANDYDDPDRMFLLSLLPDYKKLNDDDKLDFRLHALKFFRDVRFKNSPYNHVQESGHVNQFCAIHQSQPLANTNSFQRHHSTPASASPAAVDQATLPVTSASPQEPVYFLTSVKSELEDDSS